MIYNQHYKGMKGWAVVLVAMQAFCIWLAGALNITQIGGINNKTFECNSSVTLRCYTDPASGVVQWKIARAINSNTTIAANCFGSPCNKYNTFGGRYDYTFDINTGIGDLIIDPANDDDNSMRYHCDDFYSTDIYEAFVKLYPKDVSTQVFTTELIMNVTTGCTVNAGNITFTWYGTMVNTTNRQLIKTTSSPNTGAKNCECASKCSGQCFSDSYNVNEDKFTDKGGQYTIECEITSDDTDMPKVPIRKPDRIYTIEDSTTTTPTTAITTTTTASTTTEPPTTPTNSKDYKVVLISVFVPVGVISVSVIIICVVRKNRRSKKKKKERRENEPV